MTTDHAEVIVLGSGGAALVAACAAADSGADVVVLESAERFGGTTAVSGGMLWIGNNGLSGEIGIEDSREEVLTYLRRVVGLTISDQHLEVLVDTGPELVRYLNEETPIHLFPIDRPDYNAHWPGGRKGGRVLDNRPFGTSKFPGLDSMVRQGSHFPLLTYEERHRWRWPERFDWELIATRMTNGIRTLGSALVAGLVAGAEKRGVRLESGVRARELIVSDGRVVGVRAEGTRGEARWTAGRGVILAVGGFEWNRDMTVSCLRGPVAAAVSPPINVGDGLAMAMKVGAAIDNLSEAWWAPIYQIPGEEYEGRPMSRHIIDELALPGSIMVNGRGERFVNEAVNYNDLTKAFHVFDPVGYGYPNIPAWMVFDSRYKSNYAVATVMSSEGAPEWFHESGTLAELASRIGVDPAGLGETVKEFNAGAAVGVDYRFARGRNALDLYYGDADHVPNPSLGRIDQAPFYAIRILPGILGTKGGARVNTDGQVLTDGNGVIPGLYACGNAAASLMGIGYPGAGGSLGPMMTTALRAGRSIGRS